MRINIKDAILEVMRKKYPTNPSFEDTESRYSRHKTVESKFLSKEEVQELQELYLGHKEDIEDRRQLTKLNALCKLLDGTVKKISNLNTMTEALVILLRPLKKHWIFVEDETALTLVPYFVKNIEFVASKEYNPARIVFNCVGLYRGHRKEMNRTIRRSDLGKKGCSPSELLVTLGLFLESDELIKGHEAEMKTYNELYHQTGLQLVGHGNAAFKEDRYSTSVISLDKGGLVTKLVVDDLEERDKESSGVASCKLWSVKHGIDGEEEDLFSIPVLPYIRTFNLKIHEFIHVHIKNVDIYEYEEGLQDKLVLADDKRELIDLLVSSGGDDSRDIVQGKSGGVIILTSGPPGVGKTLTAEVYSEKVQRPLYVVQCSQLGTDPESLEKTLETVLERAVSWNAVLLIDESDVYIHERGNDIAQNAIVGVFLRVLEYYSGVLFMTTNRATIVDDAILSRCIAHVRYTIPNSEELVELWHILSKQYEVEMSGEMCLELAKTFPNISGRSVKQLIRLSKALCLSRGREITVDDIAWVSRFQDIEMMPKFMEMQKFLEML